MIKWLKTLFTPAQPDDRLVPLSIKDDIVPMQEPKEYVYIGDGMMEEVIQPNANPDPDDKPTPLKAILDECLSQDTPIYTPHTPSYSGDSYDSGSYSSCDSSSSGGCD